jgi:hypothetical protein
MSHLRTTQLFVFMLLFVVIIGSPAISPDTAGGIAGSEAPGLKKPSLGVNTEVVRKLLIDAFDDAELMTFCFDRFYPVYNERFGEGMSKGEKVQSLLDYCVHHGQLKELLELVNKRNPHQYNKYADRIFTT